MCGSGTTGVVCRSLGRNAILCDESEQYTRLAETRLGINRSAAAHDAEVVAVSDKPPRKRRVRKP
jgi:DNA modification methylase